jgi:hypothetical protein
VQVVLSVGAAETEVGDDDDDVVVVVLVEGAGVDGVPEGDAVREPEDETVADAELEPLELPLEDGL